MLQIALFCQESLEKYVMSKNNDISDSLPLFVVAGSWNAFFGIRILPIRKKGGYEYRGLKTSRIRNTGYDPPGFL
mgnify:CR=1 FL=1